MASTYPPPLPLPPVQSGHVSSLPPVLTGHVSPLSHRCSLHPHDAALLVSVHEAARALDVPIGAILSDHAVRPAARARRAPCHLLAPRSSWPETFSIQRVLVTVTGVMIYRLSSL